MVTIRCAKCRSKIFEYIKIGKGKLLHCWKDRIIKDYSIQNGNEYRCHCSNLIGIDEGKWVKMKRRSFTCSGTISKKRSKKIK